MTTALTQLPAVVVTGTRIAKPSFSISALRAAVGVIARPNMFNCKFTGAAAFNNRIPDFSYRCEKAEFPGRTIATTDDTFAGPTMKLPYDMTYNDITLSVICSEDMRERAFFETWMDYIIKPATANDAGTIAFHEDYARGLKLEVEQLSSSDGKSLCVYTCYDVYPIAITPMNATWDEVNTYQRFGVTLTYRYHTFET
jgi:hypothetical protein